MRSPADRRGACLRHTLLALPVAAAVFLAATPASSQQATYSYDAAGRLVQVSYANGAGIQYVYDEAGNLLQTITTGAPCTLACDAAVPAIAGAGSTVTFTGSATPSACIGSVVFSWSFGDGSPAAGAQSPPHAFAATGAYGWQMTATIADRTCDRSGTITIVPSGGRARRHLRGGQSSATANGALLPERGAAVLAVGDAGKGASAGGLLLVNEAGAPATVRIDVLAENGAELGGGTCALAPYERLPLADVGRLLGVQAPGGGRLNVRLLTAGARVRAGAAPVDDPLHGPAAAMAP